MYIQSYIYMCVCVFVGCVELVINSSTTKVYARNVVNLISFINVICLTFVVLSCRYIYIYMSLFIHAYIYIYISLSSYMHIYIYIYACMKRDIYIYI